MTIGPESFPGLVAIVTLKATLALGIGCSMTRVLTHAGPQVRHAAWLATMVALLLLPAASLLLPGISIEVLPGSRLDVVEAAPDVSVGPSGVLHTAVESLSAPREDARVHMRRMGRGSQLCLLIYALGLLGALGGVGVGLVRGARAVSRVTDTSTTAVVRFDHRPLFAYVGSSDEVIAPVTLGLVRPWILVPRGWHRWSEAGRQNALLHELAHVRRRDWMSQLVASIACAVYWFHPLVWRTAGRLRSEAERASDDLVLTSGSCPADYAEQLLQLTQQMQTGAGVQGAMAMARRSDLSVRIASILRESAGNRPRPSHGTLVAVAIATLLAGLSLGPVQLARARPFVQATGVTALMRAAAGGDLFRVRALIGLGAKVNQGVPGQGTPLILAAALGHEEVVGALLVAGADPNVLDTFARRRSGLLRTPLAAAARGGHVDIVRRLLVAGAEVDAAPPGDATALMEAAAAARVGIAHLLVQHGADVNVRINGDGTPLIAAVRGGSRAIVELLVGAGGDVNGAVPGDGNPLIAAVRRNDEALVTYLLDRGADPEAYVPGDESALINALARQDTRLARMLLDAKER